MEYGSNRALCLLPVAKQVQKGRGILKLFLLQNMSFAQNRFKHNFPNKSKAPRRGAFETLLSCAFGRGCRSFRFCLGTALLAYALCFLCVSASWTLVHSFCVHLNGAIVTRINTTYPNSHILTHFFYSCNRSRSNFLSFFLDGF